MQLDSTKAQRHFLKMKDRGVFTAQFAADLTAGKVRLTDSEIIHTAEITKAGGVFPLLRSTNDKIVGISDFDKNTLESGVNAVVEKIRIGYGKAPAADNPTADSVSYTTDRSAFPPELLASKFHVKHDNKKVYTASVARFTTTDKSVHVMGIDDALELGNPLTFVEKKTIEYELEFAPGRAIVENGDKHFIQIITYGTESAAR